MFLAGVKPWLDQSTPVEVLAFLEWLRREYRGRAGAEERKPSCVQWSPCTTRPNDPGTTEANLGAIRPHLGATRPHPEVNEVNLRDNGPNPGGHRIQITTECREWAGPGAWRLGR